MRDITAPKLPKSLPKFLSIQEMQQLLNSFLQVSVAEQFRLKAMVELSYASGLRVSEMLSLKLSAVEKLEQVVRLKGKGGKERWVPLNDMAKLALKNYLSVRSEFLTKAERQGKKSDGGYLFPSYGKNGYVTRQRFGQLLKQLAQSAGLDQSKVSPHVLRHAFACHLLAGGADLRSLQSLLGHSHITTTEIYTQIDQSAAEQLVLTKHPLAKKTLPINNH